MKSWLAHSLGTRSCEYPDPTDRARRREDRATIEYAPTVVSGVSSVLKVKYLEPRLEEFVMSIDLFAEDANLKTAF